MATKGWYRYTDESGNCWRIQTTADLADIGGLTTTDAYAHALLPDSIRPRYIWLTEAERPTNRLRARMKVILEKDHLKNIYGKQLSWQLRGKEMLCQSYYGEVVFDK